MHFRPSVFPARETAPAPDRSLLRAASSLCGALLVLSCLSVARAECPLTAPSLTTNPCYDVIVTRVSPLLSFANASGGSGACGYELELDTGQGFDSPMLRRYKIEENAGKVSALPVPADAPLTDGARWWWRVRVVDGSGNAGPWAVSRFYVDTASDDAFMDLVRVPPVSVKVSSGSNPEHLTDYSDSGLTTQWRAAPPGEDTAWVELDLGQRRVISTLWMLADPQDRDGWPRDFRWLASDDGVNWREVPEVSRKEADTYRFILQCPPTEARFWRLEITAWTGYSVALNEILLYSPGMPPVPAPPQSPYVLVVGNQHNGFTFSELSRRVQELAPGLATLQIAHQCASMALFNALDPKPSAILLSGNNADYNMVPMFEYNGEYELIREAPVPIMGICAGHQMLSFAQGYTRAHAMGWSDISAMQEPEQRSRIKVLLQDPLFQGLPEPFIAPEVHGWAVYDIPEDYETVAVSDYVQAMRRKDGLRHGLQFHPEIKASYNQAVPILRRFLQQALERAATP